MQSVRVQSACVVDEVKVTMDPDGATIWELPQDGLFLMDRKTASYLVINLIRQWMILDRDSARKGDVAFFIALDNALSHFGPKGGAA